MSVVGVGSALEKLLAGLGKAGKVAGRYGKDLAKNSGKGAKYTAQAVDDLLFGGKGVPSVPGKAFTFASGLTPSEFFSTKGGAKEWMMRAGGVGFLGMTGEWLVGRPGSNASTLQKIEQVRSQRMKQRMEESQREQVRRSMRESLARIAAIDPQMYSEVMAGRRLPQGARVIGGTPRTDLLAQLASDMAGGYYDQAAGVPLEDLAYGIYDGAPQ